MGKIVEQWGLFETEFAGPSSGNPFTDVELCAEFRCKGKRVTAPGFYDGDGNYKVRFMPDIQGEWTYTTGSNVADLDGSSGSFECTAPATGNHGPVGVRNTFHFAYADGTPYHPFGTTCYAWAHQGDVLEKQTLETLRTTDFNKLRMCVFPNEYDFMLRDKPMPVWDTFFEIVRENDPYNHLRSIHNGNFDDSYDHTKGDVTHACVQHWDVKRMREWREMCGKPVIDDECEYEGNIKCNWGSITARELVHRFWISICYGGYAGHGETYEHPEDILWWSKGGVLHGESAPRLAFLRRIVEESAPEGIEPFDGGYPWDRTAGGRCGADRLIYFGEHQPMHFADGLPEEGRYEVDVIDTWAMTVETLDGTFEGRADIELPGKPYLAMRVRPV